MFKVHHNQRLPSPTQNDACNVKVFTVHHNQRLHSPTQHDSCNVTVFTVHHNQRLPSPTQNDACNVIMLTVHHNRDFGVPLSMTLVMSPCSEFTIIRVYVWCESAILRSIFVQLRESTQLVEYLRHGGTCCRRQRVAGVTGRHVDACAQQYDDQRTGYDVDAAHVLRRAYGRLQQNQRCMQCIISRKVNGSKE